jgi:hypothetical protein
MAKVLVLALVPLVCVGLPTRDGQEVELDKKQADELVELGYVKVVDKKAEAKAAKIAEAEANLQTAKDTVTALTDASTDEEKAAANKAVESAEKALAEAIK